MKNRPHRAEDGITGRGQKFRAYREHALAEKMVKNVGSVRFELTIDGSLRYASELQRVITNSADPLFITRTRPLEPVAIPD